MNKLKTLLNKKLKKNGGFTLVEMLIVVAIIAILIAVSIPLVTNALDKAKQATDAANERAAKAEVTIAYLNSQAGGDAFDATQIYVYDAVNGKLVDAAVDGYGQTDAHKGKFLSVKYDATKAEVYMSWGTAKETTLTGNGDDLCSKDLIKTAVSGG